MLIKETESFYFSSKDWEYTIYYTLISIYNANLCTHQIILFNGFFKNIFFSHIIYHKDSLMCFPLIKCKFIVPINSNVKQPYFKYLFKIMFQSTFFSL